MESIRDASGADVEAIYAVVEAAIAASRFGYRAKLAQPYHSPYAGPHFMALHLDKAIHAPESGRADYASAFARLGD